MILDIPAVKNRLSINDVLGILDGIIKQKHWRSFDVASLKLVYLPYWVFNYDVYMEAKDQFGRTQSQTVGGRMALNAVDGNLAPEIVKMIEEEPVDFETEISHNIEYEMEKPSISDEEIKEIAKIKVAGNMGMSKDNVTISGAKVIYVPIWNVFVKVSKGVYKITIDSVLGYPSNYEKVPERERGMLEVTQEKLEELKNPEAWAKYGKKAVSVMQGEEKSDFIENIKNLGYEKIVLILVAFTVLLIILFPQA